MLMFVGLIRVTADKDRRRVSTSSPSNVGGNGEYQLHADDDLAFPFGFLETNRYMLQRYRGAPQSDVRFLNACDQNSIKN